MRYPFATVAIVFATALLGCGAEKLTDAATASTEHAGATIRLERFRPRYEVSISENGLVTYVGKNLVNVQGLRESRISPTQMQALIAAAEQIGFAHLAADYTDPNIADASLAELTYSRSGVTSTVRFHPYAGQARVVIALRDFADLIDSTTGTKKWICPTPRLNEIYCTK